MNQFECTKLICVARGCCPPPKKKIEREEKRVRESIKSGSGQGTMKKKCQSLTPPSLHPPP